MISVPITKQYRDFKEIAQDAKNEPFALPGFLNAVEGIERRFEKNENVKDIANSYLFSLLIDRIVEFSLEDSYVPYGELRETYETILDSHDKIPKDAPDAFIKIIESFKKSSISTERPNKRDLLKKYIDVEVNNEKLSDRFTVKMHLAPIEGPFLVSSKFFPYLIDLDVNLSYPNSASSILKAYESLIKIQQKEKGINKLCFIRKRKGPNGALLTYAHLVKNTLPGMLYREKYFYNDARIHGTSIEDEDKICLIYDLSVTGSGLQNCATFLKELATVEGKKNVDVPSAIVFCDYKERRPEKLQDICLDSIVEMPYQKYINLRDPPFKKAMNDLNNSFSAKSISDKKYEEQGMKLLNEYCDLAWFDLLRKEKE